MTDQSRAFGIIAQTVIQNEQLSVGARMLYALLASYADATSRECRPLNSTLCTKMRCKPSKLHEWLKELREAGVIERIDRSAEQRSSITRLTDLLAWPSSTSVGRVHTDGGTPSTNVEGAGPQAWTQNSTSKNSTSGTPKSRASAAPEKWLVGDEKSGTESLSLAEWAEQEFGIKNTDWLQRQVDSCLDWARANGKKYIDWRATVRNWVRREAERATPNRPAPTVAGDDISEDEIRVWLKNHLPNSADPLWTRLREAEMDETDEVDALREEWRQVRRQRAIEALRAER